MPRIAIIEDDLAIAQMYKLKLEGDGFQVGVAGNGKEGLVLCQQIQPDLVLLDLMMPEMTGEQMLAQMRTQTWGQNTPVMILTNVGEQEAPESLKNLGVMAYVVKADMTPTQVSDLVKIQLSKQQPQQAQTQQAPQTPPAS